MALSFRPFRAPARRRPPHQRRRLSVEQLEDRTTPTTFFVTSFDDSGPGTLRQAIIDSNHTPGANDIEFQIQGDIFSQGMVITNTVTIHGGGNITLFASTASIDLPLFTIQKTQVSIDGMTFYGCRSDFGGAILNNQGSLSLSNTSFIVNDDMGGGGGAITNLAGSLTITNSSFTGNQSVDAFFADDHVVGGGAIANFDGGSLFVQNSNFFNNQALSNGGVADGGAISNGLGPNGNQLVPNGAGGTVSVSGCTFSGNFAANGNTNEGGAIFNGFGGQLTVDSSEFDFNAAGAFNPGQTAYGGAIADGEVLNGSALAVLSVSNSTFNSNIAFGGGGLFTVGNGSNAYGGAISEVFSNSSITDSTFQTNQSFGGAGGSGLTLDGGNGGDGLGGAVAVGPQSSTTIAGCTLSGNQAIGGNGGDSLDDGNGGAGGNGIGGAIAAYNDAVIRVVADSLQGNQALGGNGGNAVDDNDADITGAVGGAGGNGLGGGIGLVENSTGGSAHIVASTFTNDLAEGGAGGSGVLGQGSIGGAGGNGLGGGIYSGSLESTKINTDAFSGCQAIGGSGGTGDVSGSNGQGRGGAIAIDPASQVRISPHATFSNDFASTANPDVDGSFFSP